MIKEKAEYISHVC